MVSVGDDDTRRWAIGDLSRDLDRAISQCYSNDRWDVGRLDDCADGTTRSVVGCLSFVLARSLASGGVQMSRRRDGEVAEEDGTGLDGERSKGGVETGQEGMRGIPRSQKEEGLARCQSQKRLGVFGGLWIGSNGSIDDGGALQYWGVVWPE